jgi:hypothetical protein
MNKKFNEASALALADCLKMATGMRVRKASKGAEIEIDNSWHLCEMFFDDFMETEDGVMCPAMVRVGINQEIVIEDLVIGMGETVSDMAITAIQQFVGSIVIPIAALSKEFAPEHHGHNGATIITQIKNKGTDWNISLGQVISNDVTGELYAVVDKEPPMNILWPVLEQRLANVRPHWAKVYLCRYPDGETDGEVFIDNEAYAPANEALFAFDWPTEQELIWFRQFCYMEPVGYARNSAPVNSQSPLKWLANKFS